MPGGAEAITADADGRISLHAGEEVYALVDGDPDVALAQLPPLLRPGSQQRYAERTLLIHRYELSWPIDPQRILAGIADHERAAALDRLADALSSRGAVRLPHGDLVSLHSARSNGDDAVLTPLRRIAPRAAGSALRLRVAELDPHSHPARAAMPELGIDVAHGLIVRPTTHRHVPTATERHPLADAILARAHRCDDAELRFLLGESAPRAAWPAQSATASEVDAHRQRLARSPLREDPWRFRLTVLDAEAGHLLDELLAHPHAGERLAHEARAHWTIAALTRFVQSEPLTGGSARERAALMQLAGDRDPFPALLAIVSEARRQRAAALAALPPPVATPAPAWTVRRWQQYLRDLNVIAHGPEPSWWWEQDLRSAQLVELGYPDTLLGYTAALRDELGIAVQLAPGIELGRISDAGTATTAHPSGIAGRGLGAAGLIAHGLVVLSSDAGRSVRIVPLTETTPSPGAPRPLRVETESRAWLTP